MKYFLDTFKLILNYENIPQLLIIRYLIVIIIYHSLYINKFIQLSIRYYLKKKNLRHENQTDERFEFENKL